MDTSSKVCCCKVGWSELILIEIDYIMNLLNCENSIFIASSVVTAASLPNGALVEKDKPAEEFKSFCFGVKLPGLKL